MNKTYSIKQFAELVGKSRHLIYRRLTEKPRKYVVRFARKEGETWVFSRELVDKAIQCNESLITRAKKHNSIDLETALSYFLKNNESESCGKEILNYG